MSKPDLTEQDVLRRMREAMVEKHQDQTCTHPTEHIRDLPDGSVCRKCGESVPPLMRDSASSKCDRDWLEHRDGKIIWHRQRNFSVGMDWMGRIPTRMGVFPSSGEE